MDEWDGGDFGFWVDYTDRQDETGFWILPRAWIPACAGMTTGVGNDAIVNGNGKELGIRAA